MSKKTPEVEQESSETNPKKFVKYNYRSMEPSMRNFWFEKKIINCTNFVGNSGNIWENILAAFSTQWTISEEIIVFHRKSLFEKEKKQTQYSEFLSFSWFWQ